MFIKSIHNLFSSSKSLLRSDRLLYAETTDDDEDDAQAEAEQPKPKRKTGTAPSLKKPKRKEAARYRESKTLENLEELKKTVEPLSERGQRGKALISDLDESMGKIGEHQYYGDYLQSIIKEIEATGGWWLVPNDDGSNERLSTFQEGLVQAAKALGQKGKIAKIDKVANKAEALSITQHLLKKARSSQEKEEKKLIDKIDSTILYYIDDIEKDFKKSPHKQKQLKREMDSIKGTLDLLRQIKGKSKAERYRILNETGTGDYSCYLEPSEAIGEFISKTESEAEIKAKLAEFKAFLIGNGVKSGDVPKIKEFLHKLFDDIADDGDGKVKKLIGITRSKLEVLEDSSSGMVKFIRQASHVIFPDKYDVKMTSDELSALKPEEDYTNDIEMRRQLLHMLHARKGYGEEGADTAEQAESLSIEALRKQLAEVEKKKKEKVDKISGRIKSEATRLKGRLESTKGIVFKTLGEEDAKPHIVGLDEAIASLDSWMDIDEEYNAMLQSTNKDKGISELIDPETGEVREGVQLVPSDYIRIADSPEAQEAAKKAALVQGKEMMDTIDKKLDLPQQVLDSQIVTYDKQIDGYITNLQDTVDESKGTKVVWLSLYDFKKIGEKLKEWAQRRYNRRSDAAIGDAGSEYLTGLPGPLKTVGNEFDRIKEQAELDEVEQYKQSYSNKDAWQIINVMYNTKNKDEMKACLYLLADMGRIRWDDPGLWRQLRRFSEGKVQFNMDNPDAEAMNPGKLHEKLQKAVGIIWDYDTFQTWQSTNESNANSKMEGHTDFCHKTAEMPGGSIQILRGMLREYKQAKAAGKVPKVDPQKFEKMIHYDIEFGKGSGESKLYFLIQGMACGLLSRDVGSRVNSKWINQYPVIDILGSATETGPKPTMADIRRWAELDGDRNEPGGAFHDWFHSYVMHKQRVYQRVDKALTQGLGQDHDDATAWFGVMQAKTAETILSQNDQGYRMPVTGYQNATIGMLNYLDTLGENYDSMAKTGETSGVEQLTRFAHMFSVFDGILDSRMYRDRTNFYKWSGEENREPRIVDGYRDCYGRANKDVDPEFGARTAKGLMDITKGYLKLLDEEYFQYVFIDSAKQASASDVKAFVAKMKKKYNNPELFGKTDPKDINELHQRTGEFFKNVFETKEGQKNIRTMLNKIKSDHRMMEKKLKAAPGDFKTVAERKIEASKRWGEKANRPAEKALYSA